MADWRLRLAPGAEEYLRQINNQWDFIQELARATVSQQEAERYRTFNVRDWSDFLEAPPDEEDKRESLQRLSEAYEDPEVAERFAGELKELFNLVEEDTEAAFLAGFAYRLTVLFRLHYLDHPHVLLTRIRQGDDQALFDFARIDKTIICHRYARRRIREAQLTGDLEFFGRLATSLQYDPIDRASKLKRRDWMMKAIAYQAVEPITMVEVSDCLEEICGVEVEDVETIRKAWNRMKLGKIVPKRKTKYKASKGTGRK